LAHQTEAQGGLGGGIARRAAKPFWAIVEVLLRPGLGGFGPLGGTVFFRDCKLK